jgi:hypothetical protein
LDSFYVFIWRKFSLLLRYKLVIVAMNPIAAGSLGTLPAPNEKSFEGQGDVETATADADSEKVILSTEHDIATHIISVDDDPTLSLMDILWRHSFARDSKLLGMHPFSILLRSFELLLRN